MISNKKRHFVLSAFFLLFLSSVGCDESKKKESNTKIPNSDNHETIFLNIHNDLSVENILQSSRYIKLSNNTPQMIPKIDKVLSDKKQLYILDATFTESVFVFEPEGEFKYTINSQGNGPKEYSSISDIAIDENKGYLLIAEKKRSQINIFSIHDGTFVSKIKLDLNYMNIDEIEVFDDLIYIYTGNNCHSNCDAIVVLDYEGEVVNSLLPISKVSEGFNFTDLDLMTKNGNHLVLGQLFNNNIFEYNGSEGLKKTQTFEAGEYSLSQSDIQKYHPSKGRFNHNFMKFYQGPRRIITTKNLMFIESNLNFGKLWSFHFKDDSSWILTKNIKLDETTLQFMIPQGQIDNLLYSVLDSDKAQMFKKEISTLPADSFSKINQEYLELLSEFGTMDNPVLVLYDLNYDKK